MTGSETTELLGGFYGWPSDTAFAIFLTRRSKSLLVLEVERDAVHTMPAGGISTASRE